MRIPKPAISVTIEVPPKETRGSGTPTTGTSPVTMAVFTNTYTMNVRLIEPASRRE